MKDRKKLEEQQQGVAIKLFAALLVLSGIIFFAYIVTGFSFLGTYDTGSVIGKTHVYASWGWLLMRAIFAVDVVAAIALTVWHYRRMNDIRSGRVRA